MEVAIIKYNAGNIQSVSFALERLGTRFVITDDAEMIKAADKVIFPGVGEAQTTMRYLREKKLDVLIRSLTQPVLGICLGMQLLYSASEESTGDGPTRCLGILPGTVRRLPASPECPVPHMGWNRCIERTPDPLFDGLGEDEYFYFVHSYAAPVGSETLAAARYGGEFSAAVRKGNFRGVQFHPERSARAGARLLANFLKLE